MKKLILVVFIFLISCSNVLAQMNERFEIPEDSGEMTLSEKSTILYAENNNEEAMKSILEIKEYDRNAQDWLILGNILQDSGKAADAVFMYNKALLSDKKYYKAYYNLGNIYFDENRLNLAIQNYKLATKYNNKFSYAYYNLGCAYLNSGQIYKAKIAFLKAIELKNTVPEFHYNLAYVYKKLNKEKLSKQYLENYNQLMLSN